MLFNNIKIIVIKKHSITICKKNKEIKKLYEYY